MSKQIIIDWQRDGLFVATGSRRGNNVSIDTLITTGGEEGASGSSTAISTQLFALAKQFDLHKSEATVIAPREILEFRTLNIPRGEPNEVPDMVRFQAQRQMANIGDTWALDYILLPDQLGQEGISALAATISPAHMAEIEATCSDLGIHLTRVLARPVEIARWGVAAGGLASTEVGMVIALSQTHADLLLVSMGNLIQLRGTRLPDDPKMASAALVAEIRRSLLAASSYINNRPVTKILLVAAPDVAERAETHIAQATGASVAVVDPATMLPSSLPERHEIAQRASNRLAAIAGVLTNPLPDRRNVIDLKNVKRREQKKSKAREYALAGGAVGLLALIAGYWWWSTNAALDANIATALATEKQTKDIVEASSKFIKHRQDVDKFLGGAVNWLDELSYVSAKLPPAEQVMVSEPNLAILPDNTGQITFVIDAKDAQTIASVQQGLTDKDHSVTGSASLERPSPNGVYRWTAQQAIRVAPEGWDPLATAPKAGASPAANAAPAAAAKSENVPKAAAPLEDQPQTTQPSASELGTAEPKTAEPPAAASNAAATEATQPAAEPPAPAQTSAPENVPGSEPAPSPTPATSTTQSDGAPPPSDAPATSE